MKFDSRIIMTRVLPLLVILALLLFAFTRPDPIYIAYVGPDTGSYSEDNRTLTQAIALYVSQFNQKRGILERKVILEKFDDANDPERAVQVAETLVSRPEIAAVIGHFSSACSLAASEVYREAGLVMISPTATHRDVTTGKPWMFRIIYDNGTYAGYIAAYIRGVMNQTHCTVIQEEDAVQSDLFTAFEAAASEVDLTIDQKFVIGSNSEVVEAEFTSVIQKTISAEDPGVVILLTEPNVGVELLRRFKEARPELVLKKLANSDRQAEQWVEGLHVAAPFFFDDMDRALSQFRSDYGEVYSGFPDWYGAVGYESARILMESIQNAPISDSDDRATILNGLSNLMDNGAGEPEALSYFDSEGNKRSRVVMGVFRNGEIRTAFTQLQLVSESDLVDESIEVNGRRYSIRHVVYSGLSLNEVLELGFENQTFEVDLNIWFRYSGSFKASAIEFLNAVEPIDLGKPIDSFLDGEDRYELYRVQTRFKMDYLPPLYGEHILGIGFRHTSLNSNELNYAVDFAAMLPRNTRTFAEQLQRAQMIFPPKFGWMVSSRFFFQDVYEKHTSGHPAYLDRKNPSIGFSSFNIGLAIRPARFTLRGLIPPNYLGFGFWIAILGLAVSVAMVRIRHPENFCRLRWALSCVLMFGVLIGLEAQLGNWLIPRIPAFIVDYLNRLFDLLWWILPAFLLVQCVQHFCWTPLERKTEQSVPSLLKKFVSFTIYLLAFFAIVAFVYDRKLTSLLATSGVIAMIIGLAIQINISNIFSGIAINLERPFRIGDWIMVHGRTPDPLLNTIGCVMDINWRTTRLKTTENSMVIIPNSVIAEKTVTNFMVPGEISRFELVLVLDFHFSSDQVIGWIRNGLQHAISGENGPLAEPKPSVRVRATSLDGVEYLVRYHLIPRQVSPAKARHSVTQAILKELAEHDCSPALAKRKILYNEISAGPPFEKSLET